MEREITLLPAQARRVAELADECAPRALRVTQDGSVISVTDGRKKWTFGAIGQPVKYLRKRKT